MSKSHKLSLSQAILINTNVMLGSGVFINITELAHRAGWLGAFSYLIVGVLMLPLILSFAYLLNLFPAGNLYTFGARALHPLVGFISIWSYFIGKLASAVISIHISVLLLQQLLPHLLCGSPILYDLIILALFLLLNLLSITTGSTIQKGFLGMKLIPVFFVIIAGLALFSGSSFAPVLMLWKGIPSTLPLVLYATVGFEVACSLSSKIENPQRNAPRAVLISYGIVIAVAFLYQLLFYAAVGPQLGVAANFRAGLPLLLGKISLSSWTAQLLLTLLNSGIVASALGGSYGILFSNSWNLYAVAEKKLIPRAHWFTRLNRYHIPWLCIATEGLLCTVYFLVTGGAQVPLQQMSALGCITAYALSVLSLLALKRQRKATLHTSIPVTAMGSCTLLFAVCGYSFFVNGLQLFWIFSILMSLGTALFWFNRQTTQRISTDS